MTLQFFSKLALGFVAPIHTLPCAAPYAPAAGSPPQWVIPFLGELRPRSRSAGLVLTLEREFTSPHQSIAIISYFSYYTKK